MLNVKSFAKFKNTFFLIIVSTDPSSPCYFNPCGIYGSCSVEDGARVCSCEHGYVYDGERCSSEN